MIKHIPEDTLALYCGALSRYCGEPLEWNTNMHYEYYFNINLPSELVCSFEHIESMPDDSDPGEDALLIDWVQQEYDIPFQVESDGVFLFSKSNSFYD